MLNLFNDDKYWKKILDKFAILLLFMDTEMTGYNLLQKIATCMIANWIHSLFFVVVVIVVIFHSYWANMMKDVIDFV